MLKSRLQTAVIGIAIIWAAAIIAVSMVIGSAPQFASALPILAGGAAASIILLGGLLAQERRERS